MSNVLWSLVGKRVLAEEARNRFGSEDPYFEQVPASRLSRAFGKKTTKRRKAVPPGLSENDAKVLNKVKRRAYRLDLCLFNLCGVRFGWGSIIGLIPLAGDVGDTALAMMVVKSCEGIEGGLPPSLHMKMLLNVVIDFLIGLVPFLGDIADAVYKCNTRNAVLLEKHLREKGARALATQTRPQERAVDFSLPDEFDKQEIGVVGDAPPAYEEQEPSRNQQVDNDVGAPPPCRPEPARQPRTNRSIGRWFGGARHPDEDPERGNA